MQTRQSHWPSWSVSTPAHSVGSKQEELEAVVQQEGFDVVTITETWWDGCHHDSAAVAGYNFFRRDQQSRRGGWIALYNRECFDCVDDEGDKVDCLWVRITGKVSRADVMVGVRDHPARNRLMRCFTSSWQRCHSHHP